MSRSLAAPLLAVLALAAPAAAQGPPGMPPLEDLPTCEAGQNPFESMCLPPPCAEEQMPSMEEPCLPVLGPLPGMPGEEAQSGAEPPPLMPAFLGRVWRFDADVDAYDAEEDVLNATVTKILNLPKRFADQDDPLVDSDAYVLFSKRTRVYDADGERVPRESRYDLLLDAAETVRVVGKVVPPEKWRLDEDEMPTPTLRAKRVTITG